MRHTLTDEQQQEARDLGRDSSYNGLDLSDNPYPTDNDQHYVWMSGWINAEIEKVSKN